MALASNTQSGTATIASGGTSTTANITAVDMNTSFLVFSTTVNDVRSDNMQVSGQLTNSTTVTFTRIGTGATAVPINWSVVEYTSGVSVQRGSFTNAMNPTENVTISSVDLTKSIPIVSYRVGGGTWGSNDYIKAKLTTSTNLELQLVQESAAAIVEWQVVEFTDIAVVQTGDVAFASGEGSKTDTLTSVDTSKAWLIYGYTSDDGTISDIGEKLVRGMVTNATTLTFDRDNTGQNMDLTWYLVEFTDGTSVQHASEAFTSSQTQRNVTITAVDTARSFAVAGHYMRGGKSPYSANDNAGVGWVTLELTTATNLKIDRALTGSTTADIGWFVIELPDEAPTISDIPNQLTDTDTATGAIPFTIGDDVTPPGSLIVTGVSDNQTVVPDANIVFGGSGANRTVTITPGAGQTGTATITVTVDDGTNTSFDTFVIDVSDPVQGTQSGTVTLAAGNASTTATITAVNLSRSFLVFSTTADDADSGSAHVRGQLTDSTTVTFNRDTTGPAVSISWTVVEYASGVSVQRGTFTGAASTTENITISSIDTAKSFPIVSLQAAGTIFGEDDFIKAKLTTSTNLELAMPSFPSTVYVEWQVVEFTHAVVQTGDVAFASGEGSKTDTLTSVDTSKAWLTYTHDSTNGTTTNIGQKLVRGMVTNATTVTFDRDDTGQPINLTWYLVEFTDGTSVQHASEAFTTGETQRNLTITAVDTARSFAVGGYLMKGGSRRTPSMTTRVWAG